MGHLGRNLLIDLSYSRDVGLVFHFQRSIGFSLLVDFLDEIHVSMHHLIVRHHVYGAPFGKVFFQLTHGLMEELPMTVILFLHLRIDLRLHRAMFSVNFHEFYDPRPQLRRIQNVH